MPDTHITQEHRRAFEAIAAVTADRPAQDGGEPEYPAGPLFICPTAATAPAGHEGPRA